MTWRYFKSWDSGAALDEGGEDVYKEEGEGGGEINDGKIEIRDTDYIWNGYFEWGTLVELTMRYRERCLDVSGISKAARLYSYSKS